MHYSWISKFFIVPAQEDEMLESGEEERLAGATTGETMVKDPVLASPEEEDVEFAQSAIGRATRKRISRK